MFLRNSAFFCGLEVFWVQCTWLQETKCENLCKAARPRGPREKHVKSTRTTEYRVADMRGQVTYLLYIKK